MPAEPLIYSLIAFIGGLIAVPIGGSFLFIISAFLFMGLSGLEAVFLGRLIIFFTMGASSAWFFVKSKFDVLDLIWFILAQLGGMLVGAYLATQINADVFTVIVPWILLIGAIFMLFDFKIQDSGKHRLILRFLPLISFCLGVYGGLGGGGNGKIIVLLLALALGWGIQRAIVNTRLIELLANAVALAGYLYFGTQLTGYELPVIIGAVLGGLLGAHITLKSKPEWIKYGFAVLVLMSAIKVTFF